ENENENGNEKETEREKGKENESESETAKEGENANAGVTKVEEYIVVEVPTAQQDIRIRKITPNMNMLVRDYRDLTQRDLVMRVKPKGHREEMILITVVIVQEFEKTQK